MAKIFSSELHRNENASIQFGGMIVVAVHNVRQSISYLAKSRKADEYAPGAIHVLRKLCEGEGSSYGQIHRKEVEAWKTCFFAWFKRVERWFPDECVDDFLSNAEDDFRVILECSDNMPECLWRKKADERDIRITFRNDAALKAARKAADEKHPVQLGSALHEYIGRCIATLVEEPAHGTQTNAQVDGTPLSGSIAPRFMQYDDGTFAMCLDNFDCFDSVDELAQDIVTTAYDIEGAVRHHINANCPELLSGIHFDCESSVFCARSAHLESIVIVTEVLIGLATDRELYLQSRADK